VVASRNNVLKPEWDGRATVLSTRWTDAPGTSDIPAKYTTDSRCLLPPVPCGKHGGHLDTFRPNVLPRTLILPSYRTALSDDLAVPSLDIAFITALLDFYGPGLSSAEYFSILVIRLYESPKCQTRLNSGCSIVEIDSQPTCFNCSSSCFLGIYQRYGPHLF